MGEEQTFTLCPGCHQPVDPTDPLSEYGYRQVPIRVMGKPEEFEDGLGAYFHPGHFPYGSPLWRYTDTKPKP